METGYKITKKAIKPYGNLSYREAIQLTFVALETFSKQSISAFKSSLSSTPMTKEEKEDSIKQFKDALHDEIVVFCSNLAETISPSPTENDKDRQEQA